MNSTFAILSIGNELLSGRTINTNAAEIGQLLRTSGFRVSQAMVVPDTREGIQSGLKFCLQQAEVVILTGGLGPTLDDITKGVLLEFFGGKLVLHSPTLYRLEEFYRKRSRPMNESMRAQALVPDSCEVIDNQFGTAPGMYFTHGKNIYFHCRAYPKK